MEYKRILVSWLGKADLKAIAGPLSSSEYKKFEEIIGSRSEPPTPLGPTRTLLDYFDFDSIFLLNSYSINLQKFINAYTGKPVTVLPVKLSDPINYRQVFDCCNRLLQEITGWQKEHYSLHFHLSPGTPTMAAIWVLLGKSRYPATFYLENNIEKGTSISAQMGAT